jgi:hypothetical protein
MISTASEALRMSRTGTEVITLRSSQRRMIHSVLALSVWTPSM